MDSIYESATLTVINAAGNDANSGLPGQLATPLGTTGVGHIRRQLSPESRRCLIFTQHQVYWECNSDIWYEDTHTESKGWKLCVD
ncbi:hypothetical protein AOQ84DRAFT_377411 [Glonium stellatum]|uniref:Uncharacterized protein n=1 Tax=Glonium stellatum TaxID=574774 RepID=A0A8E2EZP8_9PEZI|nr:hypothetical protein AOQ84DRAFT_377411 [Glonium stellatum]